MHAEHKAPGVFLAWTVYGSYLRGVPVGYVDT